MAQSERLTDRPQAPPPDEVLTATMRLSALDERLADAFEQLRRMTALVSELRNPTPLAVVQDRVEVDDEPDERPEVDLTGIPGELHAMPAALRGGPLGMRIKHATAQRLILSLVAEAKTGRVARELVAATELPQKAVEGHLRALAEHKLIQSTGRTRGGLREYGTRVVADPTSRPRHPLPEKEPPAGIEKKATGMPVRIRTERAQRRSLSTPGARQHHKNSERNYQRQQDAVAARAEAQKAKAQREPKWKRNK